jgi:hypothetical protein
MPGRRAPLDGAPLIPLPLPQLLARLERLNAELTEREQRLRALLTLLEAAERRGAGSPCRPQPPSLARALPPLPKAGRPARPPGRRG